MGHSKKKKYRKSVKGRKWQIEDFDFKKNNNVLYLYRELFLLFGCAKTEMVSEDNTVTNENIVSTTGTIVIETGTQDAIQPSTDQPPEATSEYKIIMVGDVLLHTPVEESCLQPDGSYDYDSLFSNTKRRSRRQI